jgi:beta-fructofuranosidase
MQSTASKMTRRGFTQLVAAGAAVGADRRNPDIVKAMESDMSAIAQAESDKTRPVYHFHPPANWNNDSNGTLWYKGWHHLFYQHNPYDAKWGHMHWGHARSRDLVNWEHLPIALWPSLEKGEEHVYSGGAIIARDGRPRLIYTSIGKRDPEQWMALPVDEDLIVWEKFAGNPLITLSIHGDRKIADWRDPFLFREGGKCYMVCGGNTSGRKIGGTAAVQLYEATNADLTSWRYRGPVFEYRDRETVNIECPNLFRVGTKWVLLISLHKPCEYFVGDLDLQRAKFIPDRHGVLDPGSSYASNISFDEKGQCILWLWGRTETDPAKGWNSCMAMPRILSVDTSGFLRQNPAMQFESLRGEELTVKAAALSETPLSLGLNIASDCVEIEAELSSSPGASVGLRVRCGANGTGTDILFNSRDGMLTAGGVKKLLGTSQPVRLRVFLDKRAMEIYANDGEAAMFTATDAGQTDTGTYAFAKSGPARLESLRAWPLKPARLSLERFRI